ncbi:rab-GTPase-TBC domain-containing protein [Gautieria morchelliformis]|nr:rab-GTPase-TBC domain-containing protein [Gautieria morchelliformis]
MSVSLNNSSVPVNSHPLSPDELPASGKPPRRRTRGRDEKPPNSPRPVTSYFSPRKPVAQEDVSSNGNEHDSNQARRTTADWDGSVRGFAKRKHRSRAPLKNTSRGLDSASTSTRASTLSLVWDRPSVPLFIVGSSKSAAVSESLTTPPGTPVERPILTLSSPGTDASTSTLHDLPARAASQVLSTPFHSLSDTDIQNAISDLSVISEEDHVNVAHPYHSALRVLSDAVDKLTRARIELEEGRRKLVQKQAMVREAALSYSVSNLEPNHGLRDSVLAILGDSQDTDSDSEVEGAPSQSADVQDAAFCTAGSRGQFSLKDSLFVALSEDLTPTAHDPAPHLQSPAMSITPPDSEPPWDANSRARKAANHILVSETSGTIFTPSIDGDDPAVSPGEEQAKSLTSSPHPPPRAPATTRSSMRSRANSSGSLTSMASTGLGDWMGWFGKNALAKAQSKQKSESAIAEDEVPATANSTIEDHAEAKPDVAQSNKISKDSPSSHERDTTITMTPKQIKEGPTATMRLANGVRNVFKISSPTSQPQPTSSPSTPSSQTNHQRKTSVSISVKSVAPSTLSSPVLGPFTLPPPLPAPPLAVSTPISATNVISDPQKDDEVKATSHTSVASAAASILEGEVASVLSSSRSPQDQPSEELARVQGSSLRALCNATRVMSSDPSSILVDHGQDVGELVTRLAWALVINVRDSGTTFKEPAKPKPRAKPTPSGPEHGTDGEVDQNAEGKRKNRAAAIARNLSASIAGSTGTIEKSRKPSALGTLANPLLIGFGAGSSKAKVTSTNIRDEVASGPSTVASGPSGPSPVGVSSGPTTGALSVALESIIPATAKPPTQYLARTYTSLVSPDFRPPTSFGGFTGDRFATRQDADGREPITDRYGFVYEVSSYDVLLLDRALRASNSAPGCLTGIKVADREEDDDWPLEEGADREREFEVARGSCDCKDGVKLSDQVASEERKDRESGNPESEVASMASNSSSKHSSKRSQSIKPTRTVALSAPLKIASLDFLPAVEDGALVPNHACPNTVRTLVARLTDMHDKKQAKLKLEWDAFLRVRRDMKPVKASTATSTRPAALSGGAAAMLGLDSTGAEVDVEELRQSGSLVGFSQMGLVSNQNERKEFGRLVRGGIPLVYRAKVWLECSGALEMAEPGSFRDLLEDAVKEGGIAITEIEKDVGRTMPLNVFFGGDGVGVDKLRRVLRAYSSRNPNVGYCQGMNLVASTLLLVHADEEDAFWNLTCIIEKHLPEDFFSPSLLVSRACPLVLLDYVHDLMPAVFDHLMDLGVDLPAICFSWFLSLFTDCLPVETLFRVWDVFIVDGLDVLFRIALSILRINEAELLQAKSVPALYVTLESLPTRMWEVDKLLRNEVELRPYVVNADIIKKRNARVKELKDLSA